MKILLDGYFDRNLGDDLMLTLAADGLKEHELYVPSDKIKIDNAQYTTAKTGFDAYLKVIGSGFQIYNTLGIAYRLRDMYREKKYAPLKAVLNCNISPFINKAAEKVILSQLGSYDLITVRDSFSYDYIKIKLPKVRCNEYPDMVFALPDSMIPDTPCENHLGIVVHNSADCKELAGLADGYIKETGNKALLMCFNMGLENDTSAVERVFFYSKCKDRLEIILYGNISDMLAQMKRCKVILGARLHSIILAARMGIPFVPIMYSSKMYHVLRDLRYKNAIWQTFNFSAEDMLHRVLAAEPLPIDSDTARLAGGHMIRLDEFLHQGLQLS